MFPSDNTDRQNPHEHLMLRPPWLSHHNQNPMTPIFFPNFPSPFFDEHEQLPLTQILTFPPPEKPAAHQTANISNPISTAEPAKCSLKPAQKLKAKTDDASDRHPQRKRTGKKDRHSKISTAQGVRDRRMRLSLQVARKFFDLQDILGYDKASCTIEWLFSKSKKAILDLMTKKENNNNLLNFNLSASEARSHESFLSECEVVSEVHEVSSNNGKESLFGRDILLKKQKKMTRKVVSRKVNNSREAREKARARARWRTREKMMIRRLEMNSSQIGPQFFSSPNCDQNVDLHKLGFSAEPPINQEYHDAGTIEKLLGNSGFSMSNYACPINVSEENGNGNGLFERFDYSQVSATNQRLPLAANVSPGLVYSALDFLFFHQ